MNYAKIVYEIFGVLTILRRQRGSWDACVASQDAIQGVSRPWL